MAKNNPPRSGGATHGYDKMSNHNFEMPPECESLGQENDRRTHKLGNALDEDNWLMPLLTDQRGRYVVRKNKSYLKENEIAFMIR